MASDAKLRQRKAPPAKASAEPLASDQAPIKKPKASKMPQDPVSNTSAESTNPEKKTRTRAADYFASDEAESSAKNDKPKTGKPSKKAKALPDTKPSKRDGHPIETAKTIPGGDKVEVEPTTASKSKKQKSQRKQDASIEVEAKAAIEEPTGKNPKAKKASKKTSDESSQAVVVKVGTSAELGKTAEVPKERKAKNMAKISADPNEAADSVAAGPPKKETKAKKGKAEEKTVASDSGIVNDGGVSPVTPKEVTSTRATTKSRTKSSSGGMVSTQNASIEIVPNSMDEGPFQTLLEKNSPAVVTKATASNELKPPAISALQSSKLSKPALKTRGKKGKESLASDTSNEPSKGDTESKALSTMVSRAIKRKASSDASNLVDQLAEIGSTQKKLRKSEILAAGEGISKVVKDFANSSIEAAKKSAASASEYVGNMVGGGQTSIAEDINEVAAGVVDEKEAAKSTKASKKGKGKGKAAQDKSKADEERPHSSDIPDNSSKQLSDTDNDDEIDDQTAALLKGFESSDEDVGSDTEGYKQGAKIPKLPAKTTTELKKAKVSDEPGVVYIGRIPHGFYEQEMRTYFSQFGDVTKLRLSRNKKTGRSKHFAFIEFASKDVASIVAQTMNNYLMFGHILKCHLVPNEQTHENLWKGANRKFRVVPWAKIDANKLKQPASKEIWGKRIESEKARREKKLEKVKSIGYEFEVGTLKAVEDVGVEASVQETIEDKPRKEEKTGKKPKAKKGKAIDGAPDKTGDVREDVEQGGVESSDILEQIITVESAQNDGHLVVTEEITRKKPRKGGKKGKGVETVVAETIAESNDMAIPAVRIATDEIVENVVSAAKATGLMGGVGEAAVEGAAIEESTTKPGRKRKAKENAEMKPAKKGKTEEEVKPVKGKKGKLAKEDEPADAEQEQPIKETAVKEKNGKKEKAVRERKERARKKK